MVSSQAIDNTGVVVERKGNTARKAPIKWFDARRHLPHTDHVNGPRPDSYEPRTYGKQDGRAHISAAGAFSA